MRPGEIVALFGPNGAGKTTTMKSISNMIRTEGTINFDGVDISHAAPHSVARRGIGHVPEGRGTFIDLTVEDNLKVALLAARRDRHRVKESDTEIVYDIFPKLLELRKRMAGKLSGGEQQMLAVGRAILSRPKGSREAAHRLLHGTDRPSAIISGAGAISPGILLATQAAGIRIPEQVSFIAFDDSPLLPCVSPPVTVVTREPMTVGQVAADLLVNLIAGGTSTVVHTNTQLIVRSSCGPPYSG